MSEHKTRENRQAMTIYWDDSHVEAEMELFPKEIKPLYQWLKIFVREECARDADVLVERARLVGVTIDKTNWVRVLKGRWKHDANGVELPNPYISAVNLFQAITAIKEQMRVEILQGGIPFVETSVFNTIKLFVEKKMRKDRVNKWGTIVGPTGTQKTASFKELVKRNPRIKWMESADNGSIKEFVIRAAGKCGASKNISYGPARGKLFESMMPVNGEPKCFIFDNIQSMTKVDKRTVVIGKENERQPVNEFLRALQDETGCAIIESITPESEDQMFNSSSIYLEQFEGRTGGRDKFLRLGNNPPIGDLVLIAKELGFKDAEKHRDILKEIGHARGRIRRFFEIIQDAKDLAKNGPLLVDHIEEALEDSTPAEEVKGGKA